MNPGKSTLIIHVSGYFLIKKYANNGVYYVTVNDGNGSSSEKTYNTRSDLDKMLLREIVQRKHMVIIRGPKKNLYLKYK